MPDTGGAWFWPPVGMARRIRQPGVRHARPGSDVDVAALLGRRHPRPSMACSSTCRRLLLDRDCAGRIAFEVRARNVCFDLLPILSRYRRLRRLA